MKRKVIQIAGSTHLVSLPRHWLITFNVKKGDEVEVNEQNDAVVITTEKKHAPEQAELDISNLKPMILRCFVALYKRGVDEIRITFDNVDLMEDIQRAIGKEAVGFEIIDQGRNYCIVKHVSGELEDFDQILRRTFLLLLSMANESLQAVQKRDYAVLNNIAFLEEANNRFTTSCRRYLNRKGYRDMKKLGPLYYIIEDLENMADEYKYLCNYLYNKKDENPTIQKEAIDVFEKTNTMLRLLYEVFYKFDKEKLVAIGNLRRDTVKRAQDIIEMEKHPESRMITHNLLVITQKLFNMIGPYLVMTIAEKEAILPSK